MNVRLENLAGILNLRGKRDRISRILLRDVVVDERHDYDSARTTVLEELQSIAALPAPALGQMVFHRFGFCCLRG
jgi:hypothetical protein